jgi:phosphocarrier protein
MIEKEITVTNTLGLHARPASLIVKEAQNFSSEITLTKDGTVANAKSIMEVTILSATFNSKLILKAHGSDEKKAIKVISKLFDMKFDEK